MDKYELYNQFESWVLSRPNKFYTESVNNTEVNRIIILETDYAKATVATHFLNFTIMELRIDLKNGQDSAFYLHFEFRDLQHAQELFYEMLSSLKEMKDRSTKKVLLCCSCGLTTSFFMMKLNEACELMGLDMSFEAMSVNDIYANAEDKDAILVAPQIGYEVEKISKIFKDKVVIRVPAQVFATYDAKKMIDMLTEEFEAKQAEKTKAEERQTLSHRDGAELVLSIFSFATRIQIAYRLFDENGDLIINNQIVKQRYSLSDLDDIVGSLMAIYTDIHTIRFVTPGTMNNGHLTYAPANLIDVDIVKHFKDQFNCDVILINYANAMALGYRLMENYTDDFALYFVPTGSVAGSFGMIVNDKLIIGKNNIAGEQMQQVVRITTFPENPYDLAKTPEGNTQLTARYLTNLINFIGPKRIVVYGSLIYDIEELTRQVNYFIPEEYMPEIIKIESVRDYLFKGALAYSE